MSFYSLMKEACGKRRQETNGSCQYDDCEGFGWCQQVMKEASEKQKEKGGKRVRNNRDEQKA